MRSVKLLGFLMLCAIKSVAQASAPTATIDVAPPPSDKFPAQWYPAEESPVLTSTTAPTVGAPFTATMVMSTEVTVPGYGSAISKMRTVIIRDSAGRTRTEDGSVPEIDGLPHPPSNVVKKQIEVNDAVEHCRFEWAERAATEAEKTATVQCLPREITVEPDGMEATVLKQAAQTITAIPGRTVQIEPLGEKVIAGMRALGIRETTTASQTAGATKSAVEVWWSPEIKQMLETKPIGDSSGIVIEMTDMKREEPDPALFIPPPGSRS